MFRTIAALVALAVSAGCIALPEDPNAEAEAARLPPADDRIEGMTAQATQTDTIVDCSDEGLVVAPAFCAERVLEVVGRIGVESLPVELVGTNGQIEITRSEGDAWSFTATVRVRALTEEMARDGLDTAWTWAHEDADGSHALVAGPAASPTSQMDPLSPRVVSTTYEIALPSWVRIDLDALSDNGQIVVDGSVGDVRARTDNGQIVAALRPTASGKIDLSTDNGQVILDLLESREHGYDIAAQTDNGQVMITLRECEMRAGERDPYAYTGGSASCKTSRFEDRAIRTVVEIETDNAQVIVSPL